MIGALVVLLVALLVGLWLLWRPRRAVGWESIVVGGARRRYFVAASDPHARQQPLLLCFHGGAAHVETFVERSNLGEIGRRHGYMVVFPEAKDGWIDSRPERGAGPRDLDFVEALIDALVRDHAIDTSRVFAVGNSNGGMFAYRLAYERPQRFAGFAAALANMPIAGLSAPPGPPAAIALMFGRNDRVVPWEGGQIARGQQVGVGGEIVSAEATLQFWLLRNGNSGAPQTRRLMSAGRPIDIEDYPAGPNGAPVRYVIVGEWGHRWPRWGDDSSAESDRFNAADLVMEFFSGLGLSDRDRQTVAAGEGSAHA